MNKIVNNHVLIVAGGTGGHIFPGLAVAEELKKNGIRLSWIGTSRGMENKVVKSADITLMISSFKGVRGKGFLSIFSLPWRLLLAVLEMLRVLKKIKPDLVACFGGYITVPVGVSSTILRIPIFIHEQNAIMGTANRLLSKLAKKIFLSFKATKHAPISAKFVGNPLRNSFISITPPEARWSQKTGPLRVLILGGSLGASALNREIPKIFARLVEEKVTNFSIVHQSGCKDQFNVDSYYKKIGVNAVVKSFLEKVVDDYAWADLVICRSGAGTISELAAVGVGSILVPLPNAIDNHQMLNAEYLFNSGAAIIIEEKNISTGQLFSFLKSIDRPRLLSLAVNARKCDCIKSASKVANEILKILDKKSEK